MDFSFQCVSVWHTHWQLLYRLKTSVSPKNREQSFPLHHFSIGLCSEDESQEFSCKDIATDAKTISGTNIVGTLLAPLLRFTIEILHKKDLNPNVQKLKP